MIRKIKKKKWNKKINYSIHRNVAFIRRHFAGKKVKNQKSRIPEREIDRA